MTVAELIKELRACPHDARVFLSQDAEGNSYSESASIGLAFRDKSEPEHRIDSLYGTEDADEYEIENRELVVGLWPV